MTAARSFRVVTIVPSGGFFCVICDEQIGERACAVEHSRPASEGGSYAFPPPAGKWFRPVCEPCAMAIASLYELDHATDGPR